MPPTDAKMPDAKMPPTDSKMQGEGCSPSMHWLLAVLLGLSCLELVPVEHIMGPAVLVAIMGLFDGSARSWSYFVTAGTAGLLWSLLSPRPGVRLAIVLPLSILLILEPVLWFNYCVDDWFTAVTAIPFVLMGAFVEWRCIRLARRARSMHA
ncbi:MAG: hypothetical protein JST22_08855 [Bacteroidetes bacterium]|nr:hypothetical protein [Bacteroidota bacterium]